jgi:phenylacetate-CoA ligase
MELKQFVPRITHGLRQGLEHVYGFIPPSIRYGSVFRETYAFLQESQWWSREKLEEYQIQQLSTLLNHAYSNVPYYRRVFDERALKPKDILNVDDLGKLPYLTRDIIQENLKDLMATNYHKSKFRYLTTGGSTGKPLEFYTERGVTEAKDWAFMLTQWKMVGITLSDKIAVLRGKVVDSANKGKFWEYSAASKKLILSSYHMIDETIPKYVEKIRKFKPDFIQAYPSVVTILARFMKENNVEPFPTIKAIVCDSENLYTWQREMLEKVFQCRCFDFYGHAERAVLAGQCEKGSYYHLFSEYGVTEIIGIDGKPVTDENRGGEVVATALNNFVCPLIRYRTMDLAVPTNDKCECGRGYALLKKIEGRLQQLIVSKRKDLLPLTGAYGLVAKSSENVKEAQFYQDKEGEIILNIIERESYTDRDTRNIKDSFYRRFGDEFNLNIRFVESIPRTQSGKYRFLIQKLPIEFGNKENLAAE